MIERLPAVVLLAGLVVAPALAEAPKTENADTIAADPKTTTPEVAATGGAEPDLAFGAYQRGLYLTAFELALPRANAGDAAAQTLIAELYEKGRGVARDLKEAAAWYAIAAKSGNREAQFAYSMMLFRGEVVERDEAGAIDLLRKAAEADHPLALFNYAQYLVDQRPTTAGFRKAFPLFQKAADQGVADAFYSLSQIHSEGRVTGVPDPEMARFWLVRAARAGIDTAQIELAVLLMGGAEGEAGRRTAVSWLRQAARAGNPIAQNRLAHAYAAGEGVERSLVEAARWHMVARRAGRQDRQLDGLVQSLSEAARERATALADRWPAGE